MKQEMKFPKEKVTRAFSKLIFREVYRKFEKSYWWRCSIICCVFIGRNHKFEISKVHSPRKLKIGGNRIFAWLVWGGTKSGDLEPSENVRAKLKWAAIRTDRLAGKTSLRRTKRLWPFFGADFSSSIKGCNFREVTEESARNPPHHPAFDRAFGFARKRPFPLIERTCLPNVFIRTYAKNINNSHTVGYKLDLPQKKTNRFCSLIFIIKHRQDILFIMRKFRDQFISKIQKIKCSCIL